jgi:hypothetical protein
VSASKHTSDKLTGKLSDLSAYLESSDLTADASDILKLSQQLGLFDENGESEETLVQPDLFDEDRYDLGLDWIDWGEHPEIPEKEKELRSSIMKLLLRHEPDRDKQSIIDEVLSIEPKYGFFRGTKIYRERFPELVMKDPVAIDRAQLRLPNIDPAIRFMPRIEDADKEKEEISAKVEELLSKENDAWKVWEEKLEREPQPYEKTRWRLDAFLEKEDLPPLPKAITDQSVQSLVKADLRIDQEEYNRLEQRLKAKYIEVQGKEEELRTLISSASTLMPEEPPIARVNGLNTIIEFRDDLKRRVVYLSHRVIVDSAKWSMFGAPQPEALRSSYGTGNDIDLFSKEDQKLLDNEEGLKDYMEKTPTLLDGANEMGWYSYPSPQRYFDTKYKRLDNYEESLERSAVSYKKGLRFLKKLEKMLDKELQGGAASTLPESVAGFVEREMIGKMRETYKEVLDSLYDEREEATKEKYYKYHGHRGAYTNSGYSSDQDEAEKKGLSLFDIDYLFNNKIKFYEVIEDFSKLINLVVEKPFREFRDSFFAPAINEASVEVRRIMVEELFEDALPYVVEFSSLMQKDFDPGDTAELLNRDEKVNAILKQWLGKSEFNNGSADYRSVFAYPNFVIRDKEVAKNVQRNFRLKVALGISKMFHGSSGSHHGGYNKLTEKISNEITSLIQSGKIKITGSDRSIEDSPDRIKDSMKADILNEYRQIEKIILPQIFSENFISSDSLSTTRMFGDGSHTNREKKSKFADILGLKKDNEGLAEIIDAGVNAEGMSRQEHSYRFNRYKSEPGGGGGRESKQVIKEDLLDLAGDPERIGELTIGFRRSVLRYEEAYRQMLVKILDTLDFWNLSEESTREIAELFLGPGTFPKYSHYDGVNRHKNEISFNEEFAKRISKNKDYINDPVIKDICPDVGGSEGSLHQWSKGPSLCAIVNNVDDFLSLYRPLKHLNENGFKKMLDMLAQGNSLAAEGANPFDPRQRWEEKYQRFSLQIEQLNALAQTFAKNLRQAIIELKTLSYGALYTGVFGNRLASLGTVGPRKIRRTLQESRGKGPSPVKSFALTMLNPWIKDAVNNVDRNVGQLIYGSDAAVANDIRTLVRPGDPLLDYWSHGPKDGKMPENNKAAALALLLSKRFDISEPEEVRHIYSLCKKSIERDGSLGNYGQEEFTKLASLVFDNMENIESKIKTLIKISEFAHNRASGMSISFYKKVLSDPNFKGLGTNTTVSKYFDMCAKLNRLGGLATIQKKYKGEIAALKISGLLQRGFLKTLRESYRTCREGTKISPNLEGLSPEEEAIQRDIRTKIEVVDTILTAITEHSAFAAYNDEVTKKDEALFQLDWEVPSKNFRFRVLKTFDPYHFRVGAETSCCQRLGGLGQPAAIDSYINPLAGVLVLDLKTEHGWRLAAQSYFHYVPRTKSYILDNVETNGSGDYGIISQVQKVTGYGNAETLYAMLAQYVREKYDVEYFLAGTGYSKIDTDRFGRSSLSSDPRSFSVSKKYTDWKARSSMDLLEPKFDVPDISAIKGKKKRKRKTPNVADKPRESLGWAQPRRAEKIRHLSAWLVKNSFKEEAVLLYNIIKTSGFITNLEEDVSKDVAIQMEDLENQYFEGTYAQDYEDILDDMQQPGVSGIVYTDDDNAVRGYLYGFQMSLEDQAGISSDYDEEDIEEALDSFTCYSDVCSQDPREFLENMLNIADSGEIFYATNFLVDKPHRHMVPELIQMLTKEVSDKGYKYMSFNALSATHRLLMSDGAPSKEREEKFGIKVLCEIDMYAPLFIVEIL